MENYPQELEIRPIIHQPMLSEEEPMSPEGFLEPTTPLFLPGKEKRGLQPWVGTHIRKGGTMKGTAMMNLEAKDMVRRMIPGGEMATRRKDSFPAKRREAFELTNIEDNGTHI